MFIFGGAVLVIVIGIAIVFSIHKSPEDISDLKVENERGEEMGIHYGGDFDEFQYFEDEDTQESMSGDGLTDVENQMTVETIDEGLGQEIENVDKIREEFEQNKPGEVITGDLENLSILNGNLQAAEYKNETEVLSQELETAPETEAVLVDDAFLVSVGKSDGYEEYKVICDAESRENAEEIAREISGTLLSWEHGVATIQIEENVDELLERLEQQGSSLELHRKYKFK